MRSDSYELLQTAKALEGIGQHTLSLPPLAKGSYQAVIEGPTERLKDGPRALKIEPGSGTMAIQDPTPIRKGRMRSLASKPSFRK
jgi:hypothetical protein